MIFSSLSEKISNSFSSIKSKGKISEADLDKVLKDIKLALLEADVNFKVVKEFTNNIKESSIGSEIHKSLNPEKQVLKIVRDELTKLLGGESKKLTFSNNPSVIMLIGLQGSGKTTTISKLALKLRKEGRKPLLVAGDVYRPAAIDQLETLAKQIDMPLYKNLEIKDPVKISNEGVKEAIAKNFDTVLIDTAGRLSIDEELMDELRNIKNSVKPEEILLVIDSMMGQDALTTTKTFDEKLNISGLIFTKLDGDARGGAVLSSKFITNKDIKFIGVGEKMSDFEEFYPDRIAGRILGMGDILSLIDKATEEFDENESKKLEEKIKKNAFTLDDFLDQTKKIKKMGGVSGILKMMPNMKKVSDEEIERSEKEFKAMQAVVYSMTKEERENPDILNASRRKRISYGSGQSVNTVNNLINRFNDAKKMMKKLKTKGGMRELSKMFS